MSIVQPSSTTPTYPDRSTRLMLFGIFQILLGCLCGLMVLMMGALTMVPIAKVPQGQPMNMQVMIPAMVIYLVLAVAFICLGVGSIRARRWAWTLSVLVSWIWLIFGVMGFVAFVFFAGPMMRASMEQQTKMPPQALMIMRLTMGVFMACIYILLPGVFLLFYHRASVRATCQRRNPQSCWTDRCPMPVLALSILMALSAVSTPSNAVYGCVVPFFGVFISGAAGAVVLLLLTMAMAYLAWGTYRLQMAAWWGMLLLFSVGTVNMVVTFSRTNLMEMYEKMGMPAAQLEMMRKSGFAETLSHWGPWIGLVSGAVWLGYLLYVRRYFVHREEIKGDAK